VGAGASKAILKQMTMLRNQKSDVSKATSVSLPGYSKWEMNYSRNDIGGQIAQPRVEIMQ
jgi:hypothetical protein